ncbi:MAG: LuxR C-terminal-related transcriptional regulator [Dehalococcoidia bacterium]|nr:response regulator transcription factor [Dehalococcoidia bacterium]
MEREEFLALAARLSPREREVAELLSAGLSNKQVAVRLARRDGTGSISTATVKGIVERLLAKMQVDSRVGVAVLWERHMGGSAGAERRQPGGPLC